MTAAFTDPPANLPLNARSYLLSPLWTHCLCWRSTIDNLSADNLFSNEQYPSYLTPLHYLQTSTSYTTKMPLYQVLSVPLYNRLRRSARNSLSALEVIHRRVWAIFFSEPQSFRLYLFTYHYFPSTIDLYSIWQGLLIYFPS